MMKALKVLFGASILVVALAALGIFAFGPALSQFLQDCTGEEKPLAQIVAFYQLLGNAIRPLPETCPYAPVAHAGVCPFGINTFLQEEVEPQKRERTLEMVRQAGFCWIRQEFPWEDIEIHGKGDFEDRRNVPYRSAWEKYDNIVDLAEKYGLEVIARLSNPPAWSRAAGNEAGTLAPPDDFNDFGDFVYAVVSRYKGRIKYYQIWNEPNIYPEWGERPVSPEEYTELLKIGYTRAKEADPNVAICSGALASTIELDLHPHGLNDFIFLQRMYEAGAKDYFDILTVQGYGLWSGPGDRRMRPRIINFSRPLYIRDIMVKNGDEHKPVWISEMNWNAIPEGHPAYPAYGRVSEEQQARYAVEAYQRVQEEWPWAGVVNFWFFKRPSDAEKGQAFYYFRMVEPDFTPLPVYEAVRQYAARPPVMYMGYHQEDHWAVRYKGGWETVSDERAVLGAYRKTQTEGDELSFTFKGTGLTLVAVKDVDGGELEVSLDGLPPITVDLRPAVSGTNCSPQPEYEVKVPLAQGLPDREHKIRLKVGPGRPAHAPGTSEVPGTCGIDGFIVSRTPLYSMLRALAGLALIGGMLALGYFVSSRRFGIPLLVILLLAAGLRFFWLDGQSFWADEMSSLVSASKPVPRLLHDISNEIHPPGYHLLLKGWVYVFGISEIGVRSFSALCGLALVLLTYLIGRRLLGEGVGLAAAFLSAISPFQVYYSQEARMYMPLAAVSALAIYSLIRFIEMENGLWAGLYVISNAACLYLHYSFPIILAMESLVYGLWLAISFRKGRLVWRALRWAGMQAGAVALYGPWLSIAYRQLSTWPAISKPYSLGFIVKDAFRLLALGHQAEFDEAKWAMAGFALILAVGAWPPVWGMGNGEWRELLRWPFYALIVLYCAFPVLMMYGLSLMRPAYRPKFFLVGAPGFGVLLAWGLVRLPGPGAWHFGSASHLRRLLAGLWAAGGLLFITSASAMSLGRYYFDPLYARDDYRGIARYIEAHEEVSGDAILLNAPGQKDVFAYYYRGNLPIHPLPEDRPLREGRTLRALEEMVAGRRRIFALFWATEESDPERFIESWLDAHAYKTLDEWHGTVRLVLYALPEGPSRRFETCGRISTDAILGGRAKLLGYNMASEKVRAGEILPLTLFWEALAPFEERYSVFIHILDEENHIVGQRDAEPGGGANLTTLWEPGQVITDNYGIFINPGTPPGLYNIEVGMYSLASGERLTESKTRENRILLNPIEVLRPEGPPSLEELAPRHRLDDVYNEELALLGYDMYPLGYEHEPERPVRPGEALHLNLYWKAKRAPNADWFLGLSLKDERGKEWFYRESHLSTPGYPTTRWESGEVVRGQHDLPIPPEAPPGRYYVKAHLFPMDKGAAGLRDLEWKSGPFEVRSKS